MKRIVEEQGFQWLTPPRGDIENFWKLEVSEIARTVFEHPFNVMEYFAHAQPRDSWVLYNWVAVQVGAKKSVI